MTSGDPPCSPGPLRWDWPGRDKGHCDPAEGPCSRALLPSGRPKTQRAARPGSLAAAGAPAEQETQAPGSGEMKAKAGGGGGGGSALMTEEEQQQEAPWLCGNCQRWVSGPNRALHEAHCLRFLALCPECQEPVARKEMEAHRETEHRKVRCQLCHRAMQKYQLEEHRAEQCPERMAACNFCELELPFHRMGPHLEACGARTTPCWDCGKYVMYRALEAHYQGCQGGSAPRGLRPEPEASFCQQCQCWVPEERHLQHMDECCPLPQLLGALSTHCPPTPAPSVCSPPKEKGARPKRKDKDSPPILGKPSLKPPRSKKALSPLAFTPTVAPPPQTKEEEEASAYDCLASCPHCHILLPSPTLQKHQKKCQRRAPSLQAQWRRRSPRFLDKGEEPQMQSPPGENSWQ
ncbi:XIAP-associated factor 1 [Sceloporus undulatus]|uniref:XIAP-associated factor 1 n=1 Tax=Sceloporus undulatus TaxID=8520 RepID=UPI001C4C1CFF|nr:XIAP-associated factor 1 [Sceloporus undulatus]